MSVNIHTVNSFLISLIYNRIFSSWDSLSLRCLSPVFVCFPDQKKAKGEELFDQIMYHLDIVEKDYFGLRFMDSAQVPVRMEMLRLSLVLLFYTSPFQGVFSAAVHSQTSDSSPNHCSHIWRKAWGRDFSLPVNGLKGLVLGLLSALGVRLCSETNRFKSLVRHWPCSFTLILCEGHGRRERKDVTEGRDTEERAGGRESKGWERERKGGP